MSLPGRVLVANRGEIATRILRCLRQQGLESAVLYHASEAASPLLDLADHRIEIHGETPTAAYLDIASIVQLCRQHAIGAVHPGYGFLAENAAFARALSAAGITFIGPPAEVIELMGDKLGSRRFVQQHGFPVAPSITFTGDLEQFVAEVEQLGFPMLVKASAGGGGKGMHIVRSGAELRQAVPVAASEAQRYFGDGRIYAERYLECPRHIEVQVLADQYGHCIHLWERECSIQRRFQKVIEEAPAPGLTAAQRTEICTAAVGIAQAAGYASAGTVEFILDQQGSFYFLEMNTRIQVEHPVTEMVTGEDLVAWQLRIAAGQVLDLQQSDVRLQGHAIECRICAEEPAADFRPAVGTVLALEEPAAEGIRVDSGLYLGQVISTAFDPMLAKLIAHGRDRAEAIARLGLALRSLVLLGVPTNIGLLQAVLELPEFLAGSTDTGFLPRHLPALTLDDVDSETLQVLLAAATLGDPEFRRAVAELPALCRRIGHWRN